MKKSEQPEDLLRYLQNKILRKYMEIEYDHQTFENSALADLLACSNIQLGNQQNSVLKTGFASIDQDLGGFFPGELIAIGGRVSMGKTQFMLQIALQMAEKYPVQFFSFDLSLPMLTMRIQAYLTGISVDKSLLHPLTKEEKQTLLDGLELGPKRTIHFSTSGKFSFEKWEEFCVQEIKAKGIKVVFIDDLLAMKIHPYESQEPAHYQIISNTLKRIAQKYQVCIVYSIPLHGLLPLRGGDMLPYLHDLKFFDVLEEDLDKVFLLHQPAYYGYHVTEMGHSTENLVELFLRKNRHGHLNHYHFMRNAQCTDFQEIEKRE